MGRRFLLTMLVMLLGCAGRSRANVTDAPDCTQCTIEVRNQGNVGLEIRVDDLSSGPVIGTVAPRGIQQFTVPSRPSRIYGIFYREMQRYVRPCTFAGVIAEVYRYTCSAR